MTTPPIKRRRTAQQILLRRACQTKGVAKIQDADAEIFGKNRNGGIVVLPTAGRDLGRTLERSPMRTVAKVRKVPAPSTFVIPGERKTAGKLTICESLREDPLSCKKLKPNAGKRSASGQRSGYTSRGSTKSQNSNSYPSKWPKNYSQEEDLKVNSRGSLEELTQCSPLNRTPYDHNLNTPIKLADSSQCSPIKKKARRRTLKTAMLSATQMQAKHQCTKTERKRGSSQSCGARISRRVYSGEEVRHVKCPSKSNSEISNNSSKCKLNSGNTFKNYGGYSPSETEYDTSAEMDRHFRCSDSFYKNIDKVSKPPSMYMNNGIWSLDLASEMEMQEFLNRAGEEDHCANMNLKSGECERKSSNRQERLTCKCFNGTDSYCKCSLMANKKGCATEAYTGCGRSKRSPEEACKSSSKNSVKFRRSNCNENDYTSHGLAREESYHMERPCGECGHIHKQSNGSESGLGTGGTRREPTNCSHPSGVSRPAYTMGAGWGSHGAGNYGRGGPCEIECGCKPTEAFPNRNCTEAITQTSKIVMTKRIDESVSQSTPNYSSFAETRSCPLSPSRQETFHSSFTEPKSIKDDFGETELNVQLKAENINVSRSSKQEQRNSEQRSKHSSVPVVKSNSLIFQSDPKKVSLVRSNSVELEHLSSSQRPGKQELPSCSSCQQKLPPPSLPCKQALSPSSPEGSYNSGNQQNCQQSNSYNQQNCQQSNSYNQQNGQQSNSYNQQNCQQSNSYNQQNGQQSNSYNQQNGQESNSYQQNSQQSNSYNQQNSQQSNSFNQQNYQQSNSYNQQNTQQSNSYDQQNCHQSNSHHQQNCHQSNSYNQQNCHQSNSYNQQNGHKSNSHHQQNCHQSSSQHQQNCHQCREHRSDQDCPSVTASLCECNHDQAKLSKRKSRNPRKRFRRSSRSRGRSRSASAKKEVNGCNDDGAGNERRTQSYEDCYNNRSDQMEDQCDVIKILSILQKTVAGLEEEIKRGKVCESGRSSGNRFELRGKNRAQCEQENTNLSHESCSSSPRQHDLSPLSPTCQQELPSCSPPTQQALSSTTPPYQQELSSSNPPYQQELPTSNPPCQQELPTSNSNPPCQQEPTSSKAPFQYGLSHTRPFCQSRSSPANQPCQRGWASSYKPHKCHHHGCLYSNAYSQPNNGAVPISFARPYQANNPYKYGMHSTGIGVYQDRKALPLACNWNQTNQRFLKTGYRNNQDLGMARGCTNSTEQNYQSNMNGRKTHPYPYTYTQPTYTTAYKQHNSSTNDPKGQSLFPYTNWFRNNQQACLSPGTSSARNEMTLDATQLGNQDATNRGRVTFQKHISLRSPRTQSYQTDSSFPYGNCFGEMKTGLPNEHHTKPCKPPQNVDNLRKEVCYTNTETLCPKSLAPAECHHGSPQVHELQKSCAMPAQRIIKEIDCEDRENSNTSDRCLVNLQEINLEACENNNSCDKFPRNRQDIDSEICENPNCPHGFHRHKRELDVEDCGNPNCPYRFKRNRIPIDVEVCENPNCPYRFPRNREDIDMEVCDNPKSPYRFSRNREEIDLEVCGNPNCPYSRCKRNREDIDSEMCENTTSPYRFKPTIKEVDFMDICENPSCPFRFPRNINDNDLVCENPNCPYRIQRNMTEIDSEVYEYSNTLKRSPNICASKLKKKRACPVPYQEISDSALSEDPQDLCEELSSSIESCENPRCPVNKNNRWLSGGFESFESNSVEYKTEENGFKEVATDPCHDGLTIRQRIVFTDVTNKTNRQDSGQSVRLEDDSIKTKPFSKKWGHRYLNLDKIPINTASGVQPLGCNRNRRNPYLTSDPILNYDKHCYQKHKIDPVCRPKNRTRPRNYNCNRSTNVPCNGQHLLFIDDDECNSTSTCCSCSIPQRITNCQDNPRCCKRRERRRSQREQPPEAHIYLSGNDSSRNDERVPSISSSFVCCRKEKNPAPKTAENYCKTSNKSKKYTRKNCEKFTSKCSLFSCFKKIVKPSPLLPNISEKERCKNAKKSTSKSSLISSLKRKEQQPPSLISILKKKEQPCPAWCKKVYPLTRRPTIDNDFQCEINMSKLCACTCCKKKEQSASLQTGNCGKNGRKNYKRENDSQCEKTKSKPKALPCPKKKEKIPPPNCHAKKKKHADCENENDSQIKKNKSKLSGFLCFKKKDKHPSDQSENYAKKECRNIEKETELHCELTKNKSSALLCCKKIEKTVFFQDNLQCEKTKPNQTKKEKPEENCCKKERRKYAENENEIPKECEKKPSWLKVFPRCRRKPKCKCKAKGDDISEDQERTKKPSNLTKCFSCCRKSKTRKEPCNQCEECRKYQSTGPCHNVEVRVLYDSSFRFKQESCSCFDIAEKTNCDNPQEGSTSSQNRSENRHRQCECGNEFYKIGQ